LDRIRNMSHIYMPVRPPKDAAMHGPMSTLLAALLLGPTPAPPKGSEAEFIQTMQGLQAKHKMLPMARFDSKRFTAISNADDTFSRDRLRFCEVFYDQFLRHFQEKGFVVTLPAERLMVAVFDDSEGFEAYFARKLNGVLGIYDPATNRLVLYDYAHNRQLRSQRDRVLDQANRFGNSWQRQKIELEVNRKVEEIAKDMNLAITMHECAHLISFNCGLLSRKNDVPAWLAEGLATYCEATEGGDWTRLGSMNPNRMLDLKRGEKDAIAFTDLLKSDQWARSPRALNGYGQSWALFHLLMTERPKELRHYLDIVRDRRTPESRLADFQEAFGALARMETRYTAYRRDLVAKAPAVTR
jgi:hypothetical protein